MINRIRITTSSLLFHNKIIIFIAYNTYNSKGITCGKQG